MASTLVNTLDLLIFLILIIVYYYLLQLEDEKTCNCITTDTLKFCHKFIKFTVAFLIVSSIVFQDIVKFPKFIIQIFGVINILLLSCNIFIYITYILVLDKSKCSCLVNNPLLNKILYVSAFIPIVVGPLFLSMLMINNIFNPNNINNIYMKASMIGFITSLVVFVVISIIDIFKNQPTSMWDPVLRKRRQYIWDYTLNKYVYIDEQEATVSN